MKISNGFITNSSSVSYIIETNVYDRQMLIDLLLNHYSKNPESVYEFVDWYLKNPTNNSWIYCWDDDFFNCYNELYHFLEDSIGHNNTNIEITDKRNYFTIKREF